MKVEPWTYGGLPGKKISTEHYAIFSTIEDESIVGDLAQVMEGGYGEYRRLAPAVPTSNRPMECYLFANREQWVDFTRRYTGEDSAVYLQINRGGYTIRDWYVAYFIGTANTYSVAAHEGWHQFVARHFKGRLPPFLEEGIATMFEDVDWANNLPRWNLRINRLRVQSLRRAVDGKFLIPLQELCRLHAGQVVNQAGNKIEAFYAENWAFAEFLWAADNGKYRAAFQQLLTDVAAGTVFDPTGAHHLIRNPWNPNGVRPMLEHYLGKNLDALAVEYEQFIRTIAYDDYDQQWQ